MQGKRNIVIFKLLVYNIFVILSCGGEAVEFKGAFVGLTVKQVLIEELGFSKKAITALKMRDDGILLNGEHVTVRAVIKEGDVLSINYSDKSSACEKLVPSSNMPSVIYEDDELIAVNKPPFMPTHQSMGHFYDTLANSLALYFAEQGRPFVFRSVNRLDRNTSGIVLVAKDRLSSSKLSEQMKHDGIKKSYIAILDGILPENEGIIKTYIRRKEKSIILREVCSPEEDGKIAVTKYEVIARSDDLSLVRATPITGRTHQLRVHFSHLGASILGDDLYGSPSNEIARHALHAYELNFTHPNTNEEMSLFAPLPPDMEVVIETHFGKELNYFGKREKS